MLVSATDIFFSLRHSKNSLTIYYIKNNLTIGLPDHDNLIWVGVVCCAFPTISTYDLHYSSNEQRKLLLKSQKCPSSVDPHGNS